MVYVHDLSSNGSRIKTSSSSGPESEHSGVLCKLADATLLSDGDEVFLTPKLSFTFSAKLSLVNTPDVPDSDYEREQKVCDNVAISQALNS